MVYTQSPVGLGSLSTQLAGQKTTRSSRQTVVTPACCHAIGRRVFAFSRASTSSERRRRQQPVICSAAAANISLPSPDGGEQHGNLPADRTPTKQAHLGVLHAGSIPFNPSPEGSAFLAKIKGFLFYSFTLLLSVPLFVSMLVMTPFVMLFDKYRYVHCLNANPSLLLKLTHSTLYVALPKIHIT